MKAASQATFDIETIHRELCAIGRDRAELDAAEAYFIRAGYAVRVWEAHGFDTYAAYIEAVIGHRKKSARERIRTALALGELPRLQEALGAGEIAWTHARELTRVATAETEGEWLEAARGWSSGDVAEMVSGLEPGDRPGTVRDLGAMPRTLAFEVSPETFAMMREAIRVARQSSGEPIDDDAALALLAKNFLASSGEERDPARPGYQVAVSRCDDCKRTFAEADGKSVQLDPATVAAIECDHQAVPASPGGRASQSIPPATRRAVVRAARNRCAVPGCRNATWLDVHHIQHREHGGDHRPGNLVLLCSTHHRRIHDGYLRIERAGDRLRFLGADGTPHRGSLFGARCPTPDPRDFAASPEAIMQGELNVGPVARP